MPLTVNTYNLAIRLSTECKSIRTLLNGNGPDLSGLNTTAKANLVAAINEIHGTLATAAGIDDANVSGTTTWSSEKTQSEVQAAHDSAVDDAISDSGTSSSSAWSSDKTDTELDSRLAALIDDVNAADDKVYSSNKVTSDIETAVANLVDSSPGALDTLRELATALNNDPDFAANITAALGNRVRFDAPQTLSDPEKNQALANIGAQDAASIGDTSTNFVAAFEAGLL